jgi:hypothetical protein
VGQVAPLIAYSALRVKITVPAGVVGTKELGILAQVPLPQGPVIIIGKLGGIDPQPPLCAISLKYAGGFKAGHPATLVLDAGFLIVLDRAALPDGQGGIPRFPAVPMGGAVYRIFAVRRRYCCIKCKAF